MESKGERDRKKKTYFSQYLQISNPLKLITNQFEISGKATALTFVENYELYFSMLNCTELIPIYTRIPTEKKGKLTN